MPEYTVPQRPSRREDGWPTRADIRYDTNQERLCRILIGLVESMGASIALTNAVVALDKARNFIADHVERIEGDTPTRDLETTSDVVSGSVIEQSSITNEQQDDREMFSDMAHAASRWMGDGQQKKETAEEKAARLKFERLNRKLIKIAPALMAMIHDVETHLYPPDLTLLLPSSHFAGMDGGTFLGRSVIEHDGSGVYVGLRVQIPAETYTAMLAAEPDSEAGR